MGHYNRGKVYVQDGSNGFLTQHLLLAEDGRRRGEVKGGKDGRKNDKERVKVRDDDETKKEK